MYHEEINKAVEILKKGGLILYPTDTIWGIGCDALNKKAIQKVVSLKKRFGRKSLIILTTSLDEVANYVKKIPEIVPDLMNSMHRPLTIIYPGAINLPKNLVGDDGSIGIRVVRNPFCEALIQAFGHPIVSTSANLAGQPAPFTFQMIDPYIVNGVDHVIHVRQENVTETKASTIIKVELNNQFAILRD